MNLKMDIWDGEVSKYGQWQYISTKSVLLIMYVCISNGISSRCRSMVYLIVDLNPACIKLFCSERTLRASQVILHIMLFNIMDYLTLAGCYVR